MASPARYPIYGVSAPGHGLPSLRGDSAFRSTGIACRVCKGTLLRAVPTRAQPRWARFALPTLVLARISMVVTFRKERSGPGGHPGRTADRRIVAHLSL